MPGLEGESFFAAVVRCFEFQRCCPLRGGDFRAGGFFINPQLAGAFHGDRHLGFQLVDFNINLTSHLREVARADCHRVAGHHGCELGAGLVVLALGHDGGAQGDFTGRWLVNDFQRHNHGEPVTDGGGFNKVDGFGTVGGGEFCLQFGFTFKFLGLPIPIHQGHVDDFVIAEPNDFLVVEFFSNGGEAGEDLGFRRVLGVGAFLGLVAEEPFPGPVAGLVFRHGDVYHAGHAVAPLYLDAHIIVRCGTALEGDFLAPGGDEHGDERIIVDNLIRHRRDSHLGDGIVQHEPHLACCIAVVFHHRVVRQNGSEGAKQRCRIGFGVEERPIGHGIDGAVVAFRHGSQDLLGRFFPGGDQAHGEQLNVGIPEFFHLPVGGTNGFLGHNVGLLIPLDGEFPVGEKQDGLTAFRVGPAGQVRHGAVEGGAVVGEHIIIALVEALDGWGEVPCMIPHIDPTTVHVWLRPVALTEPGQFHINVRVAFLGEFS